MNNIDDFYNSILNIRIQQNEKTKQLIKGITKNAVDEVKKVTPNLEGFCKFLASEIQEKLEQNGIKNYWIDLNDLVAVDHVVLIAEYRTNEGLKRFLIDPSFIQFTKQENKKLIKLDEWPSEKIKNKMIVQDLVQTGVTQLDNDIWNEYLSSFSNKQNNTTLDELLINKQEKKGK